MEPLQVAKQDGQRLAAALQRAIRREGLSYSKVERRLGMGKDYLRQLLNGRVDLKVKHVLAVLTAIGVPPADFFAELFGPPSLAVGSRATGFPDLPPPLFGVQNSPLWFLARKLRDKGLLTDEEINDLMRELQKGGPGL